MGSRLLKMAFILLLVPFIPLKAQSCYELVWSDEFNYTGLPDSTNWNYEVGGSGWGNNELQYYTERRKENAYVENGYLTIRAIEESYNSRQYTSARLITYPMHSWKYGKIEASIKLPYGQGIWPAFWMLGNGIFEGTPWPGCGEIDVMEMIGGGEGRDDVVHGTIHYSNTDGSHAQYGGSYQLPEGILNDTFHVFSVEWTETQIKWYIDDIQYHVADMTPAYLSEFREKFFILLNVAVGGNWPGSPNAGTVFPQEMLVDYIRVYQVNTEPEIRGDTLVSGNQSDVRFSTVMSDDFQYTWSVPEGAVILEGQGTNNIRVAWGCQPGTVECNLVTLCSEYTLTQSVSLGDIRIRGEEKVEAYSTNNLFSVPEFSDASYTWTIPDDAELVSQPDSNKVNLNWGKNPGLVSVEITTSCGTLDASMLVDAVEQLPYPDPETKQSIPGVIESVYYDSGGEGFAYHDIDAENNGPGIRQDEGVDTELNDGGGTVGWIRSGEWIEYSVDVQEDGLYRVELRVASLNGGGDMQIFVNGEDRTGNISIPRTFSWTSFTSVYQDDIQLFESDSILRLVFNVGDFNLGSMTFVTKGTSLSEFQPDDLIIYPNPAADELRIKGQTEVFEYKITGISGEILLTGLFIPGKPVSLRNLPEGIYIINLKNQNQNRKLKFIKK